MEVIHMNPIPAHPDPVVVGFPVHRSGLDPGSGEPRRKDPVMMLASARIGSRVEWGPAELGAEDHHGVFEQPSLLEIVDQPGDHADAGKASCHSDYVDPETAQRVQGQQLVQLNTAPAHNLPTHDPLL